MKRSTFIGATAATLGTAACSGGGNSTISSVSPVVPTTAPLVVPPISTSSAVSVADLRFGSAPIPASNAGLGYDPAGDAKALIIAGTPSPATSAIPGTQNIGSYNSGEQFVIRIPTAWNGKLVVAGTPSFRSAFASDAIWSDFLLANGYAYAASNKNVPYNAVVESIAASHDPSTAYPIAFNLLGLEAAKLTFRFGALTPQKVLIDVWNLDFAMLIAAAKNYVQAATGQAPSRTYVVGLSNGGAQVRSLLENYPQLVDGGVDWSGVFWSPSHSILDYLPTFLTYMPQYVSSGFTDATSAAKIMAAGYPADIVTGKPANPSLWFEYYAGQPSFYSDLTLFAYAMLIDGTATSSVSSAGCTPNATNGAQLPGSCAASGLGLYANRAAYVPSQTARYTISRFAHTGKIGKPLVSIAGAADMFITAANNATPYLNAVNANGNGGRYWQYLVSGGTHVDTFAALGGNAYGLQPQLPFAWAAFNSLVSIVEKGLTPPGAGAQQTISTPAQIPS